MSDECARCEALRRWRVADDSSSAKASVDEFPDRLRPRFVAVCAAGDPIVGVVAAGYFVESSLDFGAS